MFLSVVHTILCVEILQLCWESGLYWAMCQRKICSLCFHRYGAVVIRIYVAADILSFTQFEYAWFWLLFRLCSDRCLDSHVLCMSSNFFLNAILACPPPFYVAHAPLNVTGLVRIIAC